ncbi:protein FliT [Paraperlucidibaca baekdonensis]|uniref:Flagellar protein FliT n=1 Tax=Paraperlucidibaca baekdonensis TaxID=748120 RepID=A0A3E0H156_9GAMM|nr:flagellar protein FliT [Paraperlucidibaca baekdonensis]REH36754.1 protein FliT [Paraperlucidibaca baekdonensis]
MSSPNVLPFPTPAKRRPTLQSLLGMTHDLLALAKLGDWEGAMRLQEQRRDALELFFADVPVTLAKADIASTIRAILQFDAELTGHLQQSRQALMVEARGARQQRQAAGAYLSYSSS